MNAQTEEIDDGERGQRMILPMTHEVFESLNYDTVENTVLQEERRRRGDDVEPPSWKIWIILFICGAVTACTAYVIDVGQGFLSDEKFEAVQKILRDAYPVNGTIASGTRIAGNPVRLAQAFFAFVGINLAYVLVAAVLVVWGEPVARGSGIPEVKCYLNGVRIYRVVRLKTLVVKVVGILFAVASGLPVGKEGPMIHNGSSIASGISTGKSTILGFDTGLFREYRHDSFRRMFVTAGAAAGVAAAFGAPVGGVMFAIEEVCSYWNVEMAVMVLVCSASAPMLLQVLLYPGGSVDGQVRGLIDFGLLSGGYKYKDVPFVILLGMFCGGLGALFIALNMRVTRLRKRYVNTPLRKLLEVVLINVAVSTVLITLVLFGYDCVPISATTTDNTHQNLKKFGCDDKSFNDMATYFFVNLEKSINLLIHEPHPILLSSLAKQFVPYFFLTALTYGINVPSGLFLPSLALGANFGHMFAQVINAISGTNTLNEGYYALFGGTAMLAGNLRMTISVVTIVMEATGNASFFLPLAIVVLSAKFFGDLFNHGIFDEHIEFNRIPLLLSKCAEKELALLTARDVMNDNIVRVPMMCSVRLMVHVAKYFPFHNLYCVCDPSTGQFRGMLLRRNLLILLDKKAWRQNLNYHDFDRVGQERRYVEVKKFALLEDIPAEELDASVDLMRYADRWPHVFPPDTPVPRVYRTFRELGLRHIVVVDEERKVVGVVGRRQLVNMQVVDAVDVESTSAPFIHSGRASSIDISIVSDADARRMEGSPWHDASRLR